MDGFITFCGKYLIAVSVTAVGYLYYKLDDKKKRKKLVMQLLIGGILALVMARIATKLYDNPRPFVSDGSQALFHSSTNNGFPSDHALLASFLAFTAFIYSRMIGKVLLLVAVLVAWGRVAGHVHHGIDVIASFAIAGLSVYITHKYIFPRVGRKKPLKNKL